MSEFFGLHLVRPHWSYPRKHDSADSGSLHMNNNILVLDKTVVFFCQCAQLVESSGCRCSMSEDKRSKHFGSGDWVDENRKVPVAGNIQ